MSCVVRLKEINSNDFKELRVLFTRNNIPAITSFFSPFPLTEETANLICFVFRKDKFFFAICNNEIVGFSMLRGWEEGYEVPSFGAFIDYAYQGKGYGKQVLKLTCDYAKQIGCTKIRLSVYESNKVALKIYKEYGFQEVSRKSVVLSDRVDSKIIMIKEL